VKKELLSFVIFVLLISDLQSQKIHIGEASHYKSSLIDRINNIVYVYGDSCYKKINLDNFQVDSLPLKSEKDFDIKMYLPLMVDSIPFFIHKQGGLVFKQTKDSVVRIDNSFNHLMQNYSSIFSYNSKIHRFGGYGFFSARNLITYFDNKENHEWDIVNPENSTEFPVGFLKGLHLLINDELYIFNSLSINPNNRYNTIKNEKVWKYNFTEKKWTYLGNAKYLGELSPEYSITYNNDLLIITDNSIKTIDVLNNRIKTFEKGISENTMFHFLNNFFHNNRFYYFNKNYTEELFFNVGTADDLIGKEISSKRFYNNYIEAKLFGILVIILLVSFAAYKVIKSIYHKVNKIRLIKNGLKYRNSFIQLDSEALKILKLLIASKEVQSGDILKIVAKDQFSRAHNERLKAQKIEELNFHIKTLIGIDKDVITSIKSDFDRRIRVYSLERKDLFK